MQRPPRTTLPQHTRRHKAAEVGRRVTACGRTSEKEVASYCRNAQHAASCTLKGDLMMRVVASGCCRNTTSQLPCSAPPRESACKMGRCRRCHTSCAASAVPTSPPTRLAEGFPAESSSQPNQQDPSPPTILPSFLLYPTKRCEPYVPPLNPSTSAVVQLGQMGSTMNRTAAG